MSGLAHTHLALHAGTALWRRAKRLLVLVRLAHRNNHLLWRKKEL
ncbi:hypothetical protein NC652_003205 [Populus alba x Populus x berolinensis]|nr:hypothetical protein NC652_003205 [Populus alba x Populus x berolinensis]